MKRTGGEIPVLFFCEQKGQTLLLVIFRIFLKYPIQGNEIIKKFQPGKVRFYVLGKAIKRRVYGENKRCFKMEVSR